jgi:hypothetical protein
MQSCGCRPMFAYIYILSMCVGLFFLYNWIKIYMHYYIVGRKKQAMSTWDGNGVSRHSELPSLIGRKQTI